MEELNSRAAIKDVEQAAIQDGVVGVWGVWGGGEQPAGMPQAHHTSIQEMHQARMQEKQFNFRRQFKEIITLLLQLLLAMKLVL